MQFVSNSAESPNRERLRNELATLMTESVNAELHDLDIQETESLVQLMNEQDQLVPNAVRQTTPQITAAVDAITERLRGGGRLLYVGAGTAGRLGVLDASECPPTFGTDPSLIRGIIAGGEKAIKSAIEGSEDDTEAAIATLRELNVTATDAVVGISASGRTPFVSAALEHANSVGTLTVAVACNAPSRIGELADIAIEVVVGPEFIAGSTRLKSGTAQKLVLNMLSTLTMVRLGKTYGNVMVDLQATNEKLRARAERTVMTLTGVSAGQAAAAIQDAGGSTKEAILALAAELEARAATESMAEHDGNLRAALDAHLAKRAAASKHSPT